MNNRISQIIKKFRSNSASLLLIIKGLLVLMIVNSVLQPLNLFSQNSKDLCVVWSGDITLTHDTTIQYSDTLKVLPGTRIDCKSFLIRVFGTLKAEGEDTNMIEFYSTDAIGWGGIKFIIAKPSVMKYCDIRNLNAGVTGNVNNGGIVIAETDEFVFSNIVFVENKSGIHVVNSSDVLIQTSNFFNNNIQGRNKGMIYIESGTSVNILSNIFNNNITNIDGILSVNNGSEVWIKNNNLFKDTKFPTGMNSAYGLPVIIAKNSSYFQNKLYVQNNQFIANQNIDIVLTNSAGVNNGFLNLFINNNSFLADSKVETKNTALLLRSVYAAVLNNSYRNFDSSAVISENSKFLISNNQFQSNKTLFFGGAIRISEQTNAFPSLFNQITLNQFYNNEASQGGAIYAETNEAIVNDISFQYNKFLSNRSKSNFKNGGDGGAVYIKNFDNFNLTDNSFEQNSAQLNGGALYVSNCKTNFNRNYFVHNKSDNCGGAIYFYNTPSTFFYLSEISNSNFYLNYATIGGGGVYVNQQPDASIPFKYIFYNNTFYFNKTQNNGGALYFEKCIAVLDSNRIAYNTANNGGGIYVKSILNSVINNNLIHGDTAFASGGGIFMTNLSEGNFLELKDNVIQQNKFGVKGGGIYIEDCINNNLIRNRINHNQPISLNLLSEGGGIYLKNSSSFLANNILHFNEATTSRGSLTFYSDMIKELLVLNCDIIGNYGTGGIRFEKLVPNSVVSIQNSIFWGNSLENSIINQFSNPTVETNYCMFDSPPFIKVLNNNPVISLNPGFIGSGCFLISESSDCIDHGNPDIVHNDIENLSNPGHPQYPSLGLLRNDIGATGGPEVLLDYHDSTLYCIGESYTANAKFAVTIINSSEKIISIRDISNVSNSGLYETHYHWIFGDGYEQRYFYDPSNPIPTIVHDYDNLVKNPTLILILETPNNVSYFEKTLYFNSPFHNFPSKPIISYEVASDISGERHRLVDAEILFSENTDFLEIELMDQREIAVSNIVFPKSNSGLLNRFESFLQNSNENNQNRYYIKARGLNSEGFGEWADGFINIKNDMSQISRIANNTEKNTDQFKIYPNPSDGMINIELSDIFCDEISLTLTNTLGVALLSTSYSNSSRAPFSVDLTTFPRGTYFLSIFGCDAKLYKMILLK